MENNNRAADHEWLRRRAAQLRSACWFNSEPERFRSDTTIEVIASVFAMGPLTLDKRGDRRASSPSMIRLQALSRWAPMR